MLKAYRRLYLQTMNILAIETSSPNGTLALATQGEFYQTELVEQRQQLTQILPSIDCLLKRYDLTIADLTLLTFSAGPGSFTGIRLALGIIQGLALANQLPIVPLSSLEVLAYTAKRLRNYEKILCCVNAYMQEVYLAAYQVEQANRLKTTFTEGLFMASKLPQLSFVDYHMVGDAWQSYATEIGEINGIILDKTVLFPQAQDMLSLAKLAYQNGNAMTIENVSPNYLRGKSAWQKTG